MMKKNRPMSSATYRSDRTFGKKIFSETSTTFNSMPKNMNNSSEKFPKILNKNDLIGNNEFFDINDLNIRLLNKLGSKIEGLHQRSIDYKKLQGAYARKNEDFSVNFANIDNIKLQRKEIVENLKGEKAIGKDIVVDLKLTKGTLNDRVKEVRNLQNNFNDTKDDHKKYQILSNKAIAKNRKTINILNKQLENLNKTYELKRNTIIQMSDKYFDLLSKISKYQSAIEKILKQREDLKDRLDDEKIRDKTKEEMLEKEKKDLQNNIRILADVNDTIKQDLKNTRIEYTDTKKKLQETKEELENQNDDLNYQIIDLKQMENDLNGAIGFEIGILKKKRQKLPVKNKYINWQDVQKNNKIDDTWPKMTELRNNLKNFEDYTKKGEEQRKELNNYRINKLNEIDELNKKLQENNNKFNIMEGLGNFRVTKYSETLDIYPNKTSYIIEIQYILEKRTNQAGYGGSFTVYDLKNYNNVIMGSNCHVNERSENFEYNDNEKEVRIYFSNLKNGDTLNVHFEYEIPEKITNKYNFEKEIKISKKFAGAECIIIAYIEDIYEIYNIETDTLYNNGIEGEEGKKKWKLDWKGTVPYIGEIKDKIYYTLREMKWNISLHKEFNSSKDFKNLEIHIPPYFNDGTNEIISYKISTNNGEYPQESIELKTNELICYFKKLKPAKSFINIEGTILTRPYVNYDWGAVLNLNELLMVTEEERNRFIKTIKKIYLNDKSKIAQFIKIGKWLHNYLHFDISFIEEDMTPLKVLDMQCGNSYHFSLLYSTLLRVNKSPSTVVYGYIFNGKKFVKHCWVIAKVLGKWMSLDPTFGIFTGKLPVSHIFSHVRNNEKILYISIPKATYDSPEMKVDIKQYVEPKKKIKNDKKEKK